MRSNRWFLVTPLLAIVLVASWLWWVKPKQVNMAAFAPANSLVYLESNHPLDVLKALTGTEAWKIVERLDGPAQGSFGNGWLQQFVGWTGIGPIESVILARAQVAAVVTDLGATEDVDTLRVKPEGALIIETRTTASRIRPPVENAIKKLAEMTYGKPALRRSTIDGVDVIEWISPDGSRQIVTAFAGSTVIVGNTQRAVQACLAVIQRRQPSMSVDPELTQVRLRVQGDHALTFGYVPAANSARLLSIGLPLLLGRAPANAEFQRLITSGATKVLGSIGWSSRPFMTGIEDRFLISLQPAIVARLKPDFTAIKLGDQMHQILPESTHSVTYYQFENPLNAWQALKGAMSSQIDALSSIVFSTLLRSALLSYGIDEPEAFLGAVRTEILTLRLNEDSERSMLIARVMDQAKLRDLLGKTMQLKTAKDRSGPMEILQDSQGEFAAGFVSEFVVIGSPADVRNYREALGNRALLSSSAKLGKMTFFAPISSSASIVTYANDSYRVKRFFIAVLAARDLTAVGVSRMDQSLSSLPYSATETTLGEHGLERITRSPLGQFSTLFPLLVPEQRAP